eukprot:m.20177 g.20177  ORF g.20177 m.20177 type:complete len:421 (+) comp10145_c0_seq2:1319-2581(+)
MSAGASNDAPPPPYEAAAADPVPTKTPVPTAPPADPLAGLDQRLRDEENTQIKLHIRSFQDDLRAHGTIVLTDGSSLQGWPGMSVGRSVSASRLVREDRQAELKALIVLRDHDPAWVVWRSKQDMVDPALRRLAQMYAVALDLHATLVAEPRVTADAREGLDEFAFEMGQVKAKKRDRVVQQCETMLRGSTSGRIILVIRGNPQGVQTDRTPLIETVPSAPQSCVDVLNAIYTNDLALLEVLREIQVRTPQRIAWRSAGDKKLPDELSSTIPLTHAGALRIAVALGASVTSVATHQVKATTTSCCASGLNLILTVAMAFVWCVERVLRVVFVFIPLINAAFRGVWICCCKPPAGYGQEGWNDGRCMPHAWADIIAGPSRLVTAWPCACAHVTAGTDVCLCCDAGCYPLDEVCCTVVTGFL